VLVALLLLFGQAASRPTLAEIEALTPQRAGEALLGGEAKAPVVSAGRKVERYIGLPGQTEYELVEAGRAVPGGCVRQLWTARFETAEGGSPVFVEAHPTMQVALRASGCTNARYAIMNGGVSTTRALVLLKRLRRVGAGAVRASFTCRSTIDPQLCTGPDAARAAIRTRPAWAVMETGGSAEFWLGEPGTGGPVTKVRFIPAGRRQLVEITREIPPPF
jgi:hypothetical protein